MACINHPDLPDVARCAQCFRRVCENCYVVIDDQPLCAQCKLRTVRQIERGEAAGTGRRVPPPWEQEKSPASFFQTAKAALLSPTQFFAELPHSGQGHWSYALLAAWPSTFLGTSLFYLGAALISGQADALFGALVMCGVLLVLTPIQLLIGLLVGAGITHLCLKIMRAAHAPFEATLRTFAYVQSGTLLAIVPILGAVVGGLWSLVLQIIGLKEVHETSYGRVLAAIFLPLIVLLGCLAAVLIPVLATTALRR